MNQRDETIERVEALFPGCGEEAYEAFLQMQKLKKADVAALMVGVSGRFSPSKDGELVWLHTHDEVRVWLAALPRRVVDELHAEIQTLRNRRHPRQGTDQ